VVYDFFEAKFAEAFASGLAVRYCDGIVVASVFLAGSLAAACREFIATGRTTGSHGRELLDNSGLFKNLLAAAGSRARNGNWRM
jgi:hypothetical protein